MLLGAVVIVLVVLLFFERRKGLGLELKRDPVSLLSALPLRLLSNPNLSTPGPATLLSGALSTHECLNLLRVNLL